MVAALKGRKSSSSTSRKATRHDDNLFGQDTVEVLLAISEGPIFGLKDGAASFRVGDVPLLDKGTNTPNISNFELRLLKGTNPADTIRLNLGGLGSPKNVGLELRTANQSIVVQGDKTQIDYIDIRLIVQRLLAITKEGGEFPYGVDFTIEVKPRSANVWQVPFTNEPPPPVENTAGASNYRPGSTAPGTVINGSYRETYLAPSTTPPTTVQADGAMWFQTDKAAWEPLVWHGGAWQRPTNLARGFASGYDIWTFVDLEGAVRTAWFSPTGTTPPLGTIGGGDYLLTPQSGEEVYSYNETTWVGAQAFATPTPAQPGFVTITGLARSTYPKEFRIPVARINEPYDVRVTRLSAASTKDLYADVVFESIQEINRDAVSFPDLAIAWLTIKATDTFTQIPEFTGVYRGILVPVPSNHVFNEETNLSEFPGLWDGTFKIAYTNNPAWHAYNFIKNSRYGKNAYFPEVPDMWDFYEFGKHCSAHGIRFNEYIQEPRSISELINYIVGTAGGRYVDRGDGFSTVIWDADDQVAQAIFAPENTVEGNFIYSFTDVAERKNDFKVSFKNPNLNYREDRLRVWDQNTIDNSGRNAEEFVAVGCRDADEAVRRGRLRLATSLTEKIIVNFRTNRIGRYLLPFQLILIADDQSTNVITGRVKNPIALPIGAVSLPLRDQIYLEAGITYSVQFTCSDGQGGLKVVSYPLVVANPGLQSRLVLERPLAEELPEYAVFSIGAPKPFRITSITEDEDDPDVIEITAIEVNRLKWAFVDGKVELRDLIPLQTGALSKFVYPVTNAKITPEVTPDGTFNLAVTWNPSETKLTRGHRVYYSFNKGPMDLVAEPAETFYRIAGVKMGTHVVSIVAVGLDGTTESAPVTVSYIVSDGTSIRSVGMPSNLRLVDEPESPIFRARDPRFTWDAAEDPLVGEYVVDVLNASGQALYSERAKGQLLFSFPLATNIAVTGGAPLRSFTVRVRAIDSTGAFSNPITLAVNHPAPAAINPAYTTTTESIVAEYTSPRGDFAGILFWASKTPGFNPVTTAPSFDGLANPLWYKVEPETTWYCRMAAYDSYGKDVSQLNIGPEQLVKVTNRIIDTQAPDRPVGLALTTALTTSATGVSTATVDATWTPVASENLSIYEFELAEGDGRDPLTSWMRVRVDMGQPKARWLNLQPGKLYAARVRALNGFGYWSAWSDIVTITAAKNLAKPGAITGFTAQASYRAAFLNWTNPTDLDLSHVEVWAGTAMTQATLLARVTAPSAFWSDDSLSTLSTRTYWVRPVNTSGTVGDWTGPQTATLPQIGKDTLANEIIDATKIASSLSVPAVVSSLPTTGNIEGVSLAVMNGELYRFRGGVWTKAIQAIDISGGITAAQIASVNATALAGKLTAAQIESIASVQVTGQLTAAQLADNAITQAKLAADLSAVGIVTSLPNPNGYTGPKIVLYGGKIYRLVNDGWVAGVATADLTGLVDATQIAGLYATQIAGQLSDTQLSGISAAKLIGSVVDSQISGMAANKLAGQIQTAQIANQAITAALFAAGTAPIGVVSALPPVSGYTGPKLVLNITDSKLYRFTGSAWVASIASTDIAGTLQASQIASVAAASVTGTLTAGQIASVNAAAVAGKLTAGQIDTIATTQLTGSIVDGQISGMAANKLAGQIQTAQIANQAITAALFAAGTAPVGDVASLPSPSGYAGPNLVFNRGDGKLYRLVSGAWVTAIAATDIAGTLQASQIASVAAASVTGTLTAGQIASVAAASVTGTLTAGQIASVNAAAVAGKLTAGQIDTITAAQLTGKLAAGQIDTITTAQLTGSISASQITSLATTQLTGSIVSTQIADGSISTPKIATGAVVAGSIAAGSIIASKLAISSSNVWPNSNARMVKGDGTPTGATVFAGASGAFLYPPRSDNAYGGVQAFLMRPGSETPAAGSDGYLFFRLPDSSGNYSRYFPVSPNVLYEWSCYIAAYSCNCQLYVDWIDSSNNAISRAYTSPGVSSSFPPTRQGGTATSPPNAVACAVNVVAYWTGGPNPHCFVSAPMMTCPTGPGLELSPYTDSGATILDGGSIVTGTVAANKIVANSITAAQIAAGTITAAQIAAGTITSGQIAANTIVGSNIAGSTITAANLVAGTITAGQIAANTITGANIAGRTITAANLVAGTITAGELAANSVTSAQITAGAVTTAAMTAGSIDANRLIAQSITTALLAAQAVTADKIQANTITAGQIAAGTITTTQIAAGTIQAGNIAAGAVTASKITLSASNETFNADLGMGLAGWTINQGGLTGATVLNGGLSTELCPAGMTAIVMRTNAVPTGGYADVVNQPIDAAGNVSRYFVTAGARYELSAYLSPFRCRGYVNLVFWDKNGNYVTEYAGNQVISPRSRDQSLANWNAGGRSFVIVDAPAGAASADLRFRTNAPYTGPNDCYLFISGVMFAQAAPGQTEASPYVDPGITTITGGAILTNSIGADKIIANSITASQIAAGTITSGQIAANTIVGSNIAGSTITGTNIAGRTITAANLVAGTITAGELAANSVTASQIQAGAVTTASMTAGSIDANRLVAQSITTALLAAQSVSADKILANSITAGQIASGTITGDRIAGATIQAGNIAAGAITASKLTISSSNVWPNSNGRMLQRNGLPACAVVDPGTSGAFLDPPRPDNAYGGTQAFLMRPASTTPANNSYGVLCFRLPNAAGIYDLAFPVTGGVLYEWSCYVASYDSFCQLYVDWIDGAGAIISRAFTSGPSSSGIVRQGGTATSPSNAAACRINVIAYWTGGPNPHCFVSAPMMTCPVAAGAELSPYTDSGVTRIDGGTISANSISADRILANSITATQIAAGTITAAQIAGATITGAQIAGSTITGTNISAGTLTAREIAANSITTNKLVLVNRELNLTGFNFRWNKAAAQVQWDAGTIFYRNDNGTMSGVNISAGYAPADGWMTIVWYKDRTNLDWTNQDLNFAENSGNINCITIATYSGGGQLAVKHGPTVLDGDRIITGSLHADRIIAGTITADKIQAGTITSSLIKAGTIEGDRLAVRTLSADRFIAGTITAYEIAVRTLTADRFAAGTISAYEIGANAITSEKLSAGAVTAREIAAGAVTTNKLTIMNREINIIGINIRYKSETRQILWDGGAVFYRGDDNGMKSANISAGGFTVSGSSWYAVLWYKGADHFDYNPDVNFASNSGDPNWVTIATYDNAYTLSVNYGPTLIDGGAIITNSITADRIRANTITAGQMAANSITAASIQAGAVGVAQLAAGAITADKIGVGLSSGNLINNSDLMAGSFNVRNIYGSAAETNTGTVGVGDANAPAGMNAAYIYCANSNSAQAGKYMDLGLVNYRADGNDTANRLPVQPGRRYEFSVYANAYYNDGWDLGFAVFDGGGALVADFHSPRKNGVSLGSLQQWPRQAMFIDMPGNAAYGHPYARCYIGAGQGTYLFASGYYLALAAPNQTEFSPWAPGASTVIGGGQIFTNSLHADRIIAGTITADKIAAGTISGDKIAGNTITGDKIVANSITADKITIGYGQSLTSWMYGPNTTQINGGAIAANSITANKLTVGMRGLNTLGFNFSYTKADRTIRWDPGTIFWQGDDGGAQGVNCPAGAFTVNGSNWYAILWYKGRSNLDYTTEVNLAFTDPNWVTIAIYDNGTGLQVLWGSTIIDGARIITGSITADQIAANAIQANKIASNAIKAQHIEAGQVTADKISGGTLQAGTIKLNDDRLVIEAYNGAPRILCRDGAGNLRVMLGQTSGFSPNGGDWGLVIWDNSNRVIFAPSGINGETIWASSINAGSIKADQLKATVGSFDSLIVREAQIGSLVVGTGNVKNNAVSQLVASNNPNGQSTSVTLYVRAGARVRISGQRIGNPSAQYPLGQNTGAIRIRRDGNDILAVPANYMLSWNSGANASNKILLGHYVSVIDSPGEGNHTYEINDDNNAGVQGVYIEVTELAK